MTARKLNSLVLCLAATSCVLGACGNEEDPQAYAVLDTKDYVNGQLEALLKASKALQAAAPAPDDDGWNADDDEAAVDKMRAAWGDARDAYERIEGSIAILFMELDISTDERYDGFIEGEPDENLFDGEGVTGMHAIERILWAGEHPESVVEFESGLDGYKEAAFPKNEDEATDFKTKLAKRLVDDVTEMRDQFEPKVLDAATAFGGVIGSMEEQIEKVTAAASAEDESRYAERTLDDMRANLEGGIAVYEAFRPWVRADAGDDVDEDIQAAFDRLEQAYEDIDGAAIPAPPDDFNALEPTEDQLDTPYGKLFAVLEEEADLERESSLVGLMVAARAAMNIDGLEP